MPRETHPRPKLRRHWRKRTLTRSPVHLAWEWWQIVGSGGQSGNEEHGVLSGAGLRDDKAQMCVGAVPATSGVPMLERSSSVCSAPLLRGGLPPRLCVGRSLLCLHYCGAALNGGRNAGTTRERRSHSQGISVWVCSGQPSLGGLVVSEPCGAVGPAPRGRGGKREESHQGGLLWTGLGGVFPSTCNPPVRAQFWGAWSCWVAGDHGLAGAHGPAGRLGTMAWLCPLVQTGVANLPSCLHMHPSLKK